MLGLAGSLLLVGAAPAAAAPTQPPNCSFDAVTGVQTCITTASSTTPVGPFTTGVVPASTTFGGLTGAQICDGTFGLEPPVVSVQFDDVTFTENVVTTTTTTRHGIRGKVISTVTTTETTFGSYLGGTLICFYI